MKKLYNISNEVVTDNLEFENLKQVVIYELIDHISNSIDADYDGLNENAKLLQDARFAETPEDLQEIVEYFGWSVR